MTRPAHFFDIDSAEQLFYLLKRVANSFSSMKGKRTQDLLFLIFGLAHLREWVAPDYDQERPAKSPEEEFFKEIGELEDFKILKRLCNRSKHMSRRVGVMGTMYGATIDDAPDIDSLSDFDRGAPIAYSVDERDVEELVRTVLKFYDERWFRIRGTAA